MWQLPGKSSPLESSPHCHPLQTSPVAVLRLNPPSQTADKTLRRTSIPTLDTADHYVALVVEKYRVATGPGSAAHEAARQIMPTLREWGNRYLQNMTPTGAYSKGTAITLASHIDILVLLRPAPETEMREIFWSLFKYLTDHGYRPHTHGVAMRIQSNGLDIDLLPACQMDGSSHDHMVFDKSAKAGIGTNVSRHVHLVANSRRTQEICALKIWRAQSSLDFPSLYLELTALAALEKQRFGQLADNVMAVLRYISARLPSTVVKDPANPDNVISDSLSPSEKQIIAKAAAKELSDENWKRILW